MGIAQWLGIKNKSENSARLGRDGDAIRRERERRAEDARKKREAEQAARKALEEKNAALMRQISERVENRMTVNALRGQKGRDSVISHVYQHLLEYRASRGAKLVSESEISQLDADVKALDALATRMERTKGSSERGLGAYKTLEEYTAGCKTAEEKAQRTKEYYLSEYSVSDDELNAYKKRSPRGEMTFSAGDISYSNPVDTRYLGRMVAGDRPLEEKRAIVLHSTEGDTVEGAVSTLNARGLTYHYLIDRDGKVVQLADPRARVGHALNHNKGTIGISFVGDTDNGRSPINAAQIASAEALARDLKQCIPTLQGMTSHKIIDPSRKSDPQGVSIADVASASGLEFWS